MANCIADCCRRRGLMVVGGQFRQEKEKLIKS